jgi:hypothetical protein
MKPQRQHILQIRAVQIVKNLYEEFDALYALKEQCLPGLDQGLPSFKKALVSFTSELDPLSGRFHSSPVSRL